MVLFFINMLVCLFKKKCFPYSVHMEELINYYHHILCLVACVYSMYIKKASYINLCLILLLVIVQSNMIKL